jgi:hypothetical protein
MVKVNVQPDCGNAPKKLLLRDFTIAVANNDVPFILDSSADDIHWEVVGYQSIKGKTKIENLLKEILYAKLVEVTIANIITHGDAGSVNGTLKLIDGSIYGFCHVHTFTSHAKNARIKEITSYIIEHGKV